MADLWIDDATTGGASAGLRAAANRLSPVVRAVQMLDTGAAGANALAAGLDVGDQTIVVALNGLGAELSKLASQVDAAAANFAATDQALAADAADAAS
jgi:hypothetical protein